MKRSALLMVSMLFAGPVFAAQSGFDSSKLYFGAGLSQNDVSGSSNGTGYQFFGGYGLGPVAKNINLDLELGYMDTGNMDVDVSVSAFGTTISASGSARAKGLWSTVVGRFALNPQFDLLGRVGFDFGDDDGLMFGVGGGYNYDKRTQLRLEYVERDNVNSLQFNLVYRP